MSLHCWLFVNTDSTHFCFSNPNMSCSAFVLSLASQTQKSPSWLVQDRICHSSLWSRHPSMWPWECTFDLSRVLYIPLIGFQCPCLDNSRCVLTWSQIVQVRYFGSHCFATPPSMPAGSEEQKYDRWSVGNNFCKTLPNLSPAYWWTQNSQT